MREHIPDVQRSISPILFKDQKARPFLFVSNQTADFLIQNTAIIFSEIVVPEVRCWEKISFVLKKERQAKKLELHVIEKNINALYKFKKYSTRKIFYILFILIYYL